MVYIIFLMVISIMDNSSIISFIIKEHIFSIMINISLEYSLMDSLLKDNIIIKIKILIMDSLLILNLMDMVSLSIILIKIYTSKEYLNKDNKMVLQNYHIKINFIFKVNGQMVILFKEESLTLI